MLWKKQPHFVQLVLTQGKGISSGFPAPPPCCHTPSNLWFHENTLNEYIFKNILVVMSVGFWRNYALSVSYALLSLLFQ